MNTSLRVSAMGPGLVSFQSMENEATGPVFRGFCSAENSVVEKDVATDFVRQLKQVRGIIVKSVFTYLLISL